MQCCDNVDFISFFDQMCLSLQIAQVNAGLFVEIIVLINISVLNVENAERVFYENE